MPYCPPGKHPRHTAGRQHANSTKPFSGKVAKPLWRAVRTRFSGFGRVGEQCVPASALLDHHQPCRLQHESPQTRPRAPWHPALLTGVVDFLPVALAVSFTACWQVGRNNICPSQTRCSLLRLDSRSGYAPKATVADTDTDTLPHHSQTSQDGPRAGPRASKTKRTR